MKLEDVCEVYSGYALKAFHDSDEGYPVIKIGNICSDGTIDLGKCQYTTDSVNEKYYSKKGDIYVALSGATTGKIGIMDTADKYIINQRVGIVRKLDKDISDHYIKYFLMNKTEKILEDASGCAQPNISPRQIGQYEFPRLDYFKMNQISEILDKVSNVITQRKLELEKLDDLIKARFVELFGDQKYPTISLIELIEDGAGLSYGIVVPGDNVEDGVPMIRPLDFKNDNLCLDNVYRVAPEIEVKYARTRLIGNEILVQVIGQPGQIMLSDDRCKGMNVTRNLAVIRPNCNRINRIYLKTYMQTQEAQAFMLGETKQSTLKQLPLGRLKELEVPVPSMELQKHFATFVEQTDKSKIVVQKALDEAQLLFDSLMQQYFG